MKTTPFTKKFKYLSTYERGLGSDKALGGKAQLQLKNIDVV